MEDYLGHQVLLEPEGDAKDNIKKPQKINIWATYKKLERKKSLLGKVQKALETISNGLLNHKQANDISDLDLADCTETKYDFSKSDANIDNLREEYRKSEYNTKCLRDRLSEEISCMEDKLKKEIQKGMKIRKNEELLKYRNGILQNENAALHRSLEELKMFLKNADEEKNMQYDDDKTESISRMYSDMTSNALDRKRSTRMQCTSHCKTLGNKTRSPYIGTIREEETPPEKSVRNIPVCDTDSIKVNNIQENRSKPAPTYGKQYGDEKECVLYNSDDADDMEQLLSMFETFRTTSNNCCFCPLSCTPLKPGIVYTNEEDLTFSNSAFPFVNVSRRPKKSPYRYQQQQIPKRKEQEDYLQEEKRRAFSLGFSFLIAIGIFFSLYYRYTNN